MSSVLVVCRISGCKQFGKVKYTELHRFRRHLALDHDRKDLYQFAYDYGIIEDPSHYHNTSYVLQQVAEFSRVEKN